MTSSRDEVSIDHEVVIVGAGPAGAAAAIELARSGVDALLVDKAQFPRDKCCGDGLTTLALRLLDDLGLDPAMVESWTDVDDVYIRAPNGRVLELPLPRDRGRFAAIASRADLDAALVQRARAEGATVTEGSKVVDVVPQPGHIRVAFDDGRSIAASHVIAADGMWSPVRKMLHLDQPGYRGEWHAFRQYRRASGPEARKLWVWFEPDLLPGYAWSFPLTGQTVNVGFGVVRGDELSGKKMASLWRDLLNRPHIAEVLGDNEPEGPHRAWPIPANIPDVSLVGPRTMFVGDAARATDPMSGEGIGQALETGILAARAIVEHRGEAPHNASAAYEAATRKALVADHRMAAGLSRLLSFGPVANASLATVDLNDWTRRNFVRWLFEDYPRAALFTPRRWHRRLFTSDGAYVK